MDSESLRLRRTRYQELMADELDRWVPILRAQGATLIVLFGSLARDQTGLLGDVDLLVVLPSQLSFVERTAECYRLLAPKVDLDLIAYTPEEFERMRERPFVAQVLREGRVLHETAA